MIKYKNISFQIIVTIFLVLNVNTYEPQELNHKTISLIKNVTWIENACVKISGSQTLYFDPYNISIKDSADIILVTHDHGDHFSMSDIDKIKTKNTIIVGPSCVTKSIQKNKRTVKVGDVLELNGIKIQVVPSYNFKIDNHAKYKGYVGFIVTIDGVSYYHPGDLDFIPEFKKVKTDVAFLPVCGTYMMSAEDAAKAASIIKPKVVIPFHWGSVIGTKADAEKFKSIYSGRTVILRMQKEPR